LWPETAKNVPPFTFMVTVEGAVPGPWHEAQPVVSAIPLVNHELEMYPSPGKTPGMACADRVKQTTNSASKSVAAHRRYDGYFMLSVSSG
jgi:hypothetical protein